jgi:hypothetical protein
MTAVKDTVGQNPTYLDEQESISEEDDHKL